MTSLEEPAPLLHYALGDLYPEKVANLAAALEAGDDIEREGEDALGASSRRSRFRADVRQPLMVFGDLGKMLAAAANCGDVAALAAVAEGGWGWDLFDGNRFGCARARERRLKPRTLLLPVHCFG